MTENLTPQQILSLPLGDGNLSDAKTVAQYLIRVAQSGDSKRPFGNSDWETPLIFAFANANLMWLRTDEDGLIDDYPGGDFEEILNNLYEFLFQADYTTLTLPPEPKEWFVVCVETDLDGNRSFEDHFATAYTEEEAKTKAAKENQYNEWQLWVAVRIPPVS